MLLLLAPSLLLLVFSPSPVDAQYDLFTFNVSLMCREQRQFVLDATFNIRAEEKSRSIEYGSIGHVNRPANGGLTHFELTGFFEFELSRAPVWEPVGRIQHNCLPAGSKAGMKRIDLNFASVPAKREKTRYIYTFYMDITDKAGEFLPEAEITEIK